MNREPSEGEEGQKLYILIGVLCCLGLVGFVVNLYLKRGDPLVLEGEPAWADLGAIVLSKKGEFYYFNDEDWTWKPEELGRPVRVTGRVIVDDRYKAPPDGGAGTGGRDRFILFPEIEFLDGK